MKSDCYFEIGNSHEICQDYAYSGKINENVSYGIISDGCTMSHMKCGQVDFGARVLTHSSKDVLSNYFYKNSLWPTPISNEIWMSMNKSFRERTIITARMIERYLMLPKLFLDCTLLTCFADTKGSAGVFIYGDGSVFIEFKDGRQLIIDITFLSGAPYYLSYHTDPERKAAYIYEYGETPVLIDKYWIEDGEVRKKESDQAKTSDVDLYSKTSFREENVDFISVMSDGAKSFSQKEELDFKDLSYLDIISEWNSIKNRNGVFIQRKMKSLAKKQKKEEISHYDDISIASIIVGE